METNLLTHLNENTVHSTKKHAVLHLEAVSETSALGKLVLLDGSNNLIHFALNGGFVGLVSTELGKVDLCLLDVSTLNIESRRFRSEDSSEENGTGKDELDGNSESPREGIVSVVEGVVDGVGEEARNENRYEFLGFRLDLV